MVPNIPQIRRIAENLEKNLEKLSEKYIVHTHINVKNIDEVCFILEEISKLGPVKLVFFEGHGNRLKMGSGSNDLLDAHDPKMECLRKLPDDVAFILDGCYTGSTYYEQKNLQREIANLKPGSTVFANAEDMYLGATHINLTPKLQVGHLNPRYYGSLYGPLLLINFPIKFLPFRTPMAEISPSKSDFCKELIPYFNTKQWCDHVGVKPENQALLDCEKNYDCLIEKGKSLSKI